MCLKGGELQSITDKFNMIKEIKNTINKYNMFSRGDKLLLAVSGGVDSVVMLHALNNIKEEYGLTDSSLGICHLNHNLRGGESDRDFAFVEEIASKLGLKFVGEKLTVAAPKGVSTQAWAREKRYEFFKRAADEFGATHIALGHNSDDRVETFLLRLISGAGSDGLTGMKPVRENIIRPLIETSRKDITKYALDNNINFVEDSTNKSTKYERNLVRSELLPLLEKNYNSNIKNTIKKTTELIEQDNDFLNALAFGKAREVSSHDGDRVVLDRLKLSVLHKSISSRIILNTLFEVSGGGSFYSVHIDSVMDIAASGKPNSYVDLPGGIKVVREYDNIIVTTSEAELVEDYESEILVNEITMIDKTDDVFKSEVVKNDFPASLTGNEFAVFDFDKMKSPLNVRNIREGDRMRPFGLDGTKKLKDILIDLKIPRRARKTMPLVVSGEDILWAVGVKRSDLFKVTKDTKEVLKITHWKS